MDYTLLTGYPGTPGSYDEMMEASLRPRGHWRAMLDSLAGESPAMMRQRIEVVQRQVRENGVTYNVYADAKGMQRPWDLNVLPLILPYDEWAQVEAAVAQRATLLNRILLDVYGEQRLLAEGLLPPALVHGHAGFLRPCQGIRHQGDIALHFYALDLARAPDGRWWVVGDRTQAPSGAGYALENRAVIGRIFPDMLRDLKVRKLEGFFDTMRDSLAHWGRRSAGAGLRAGEPPLMVLLTPGPHNETYYEHTYLARYLGLPLVEGGDLTVRNGMVWLKTLSGMQRVHVIVRRVDDDFCDPLELRADSALGVAGLTDAVRRGTVLVTNSLGSSLLESGALLGFLPSLCQRLLGEPLKMPSVATWWCGEAAALDTVVSRLDSLVIKPAFPQLRQGPVFGADQRGDARAALIGQLRANPGNYVAQELVRLSQAPVWKEAPRAGLYPCATGLRVYACATPKGYVVMPGGLTRVATGPDARVITMQQGGGSKDTWVQARAQQDLPHQERGNVERREPVRDDTHLSSRVAENLHWFGRNTERCDNIARLLRVTLNFLFHVRPDDRGAEWAAMTGLCQWYWLIAPPEPTDVTAEPVQPAAMLTDAQIESALLRAVVSPDVPGLVQQQQQLYRCASQLRERISLDNWRAISKMRQDSPVEEQPSQAEAMRRLDDATEAAMLMSGYAMDGMSRDLGWRFMSLGRRLERLQFQCQILRRGLAMDGGDLEWMLLLSDSIITYRARYQARPEWLPLLDLLLLDESNTRSIVFQVDGILKTLQQMAPGRGPAGTEQLAALADELQALTPEADLVGGSLYLADLLQRLIQTSETLSEQIGVQFFSHTGKAAGEGS
ncbi:circularly permuted type 2 ATP-grasp protein [Undibacterium sp. CY18W]|uniref:Circularly permuted type 2 ATP-grasp protein n=1 Tax=Undibacterium hunanense TaxID=2762292 RepID=A0ABR6ZYQ7_9BURK|nr:circularly permuted type 2 ATP-grasp protein [Undibacterium hunanense]MBC3921016.1 circularly permuted type 2 ATP-grasp protein [Undibacterium hunanense]